MYKDNLWKIFSVREGAWPFMARAGGRFSRDGFFFPACAKTPFLSLADLAAPSLALGQAIGRWGNFVNQEAYGYTVTNPALCHFPISVFIEADGQWHLATFFYESVWCFGIRRLYPPDGSAGKLRRRGDAFLWYSSFTAWSAPWSKGLRTDSLMLVPCASRSFWRRCWPRVRSSPSLSARGEKMPENTRGDCLLGIFVL